MRLPFKITLADGILALGVCVTAIVCFVVLFCSPAGGQVRVTTPTEQATFSLRATETRTFTGKDGHTVTVTIENGRACVSHADCADKLCVRSGWLSRAGQTAACLPAGIVVSVTGETEVDAVAH